MIDVPATIGAVASILVPIGTGVAFIWTKIERRFTKIEAELEQCRKRDLSHRVLIPKLLFVMRLLLVEVAPGSAVLAHAQKIMDEAEAHDIESEAA